MCLGIKHSCRRRCSPPWRPTPPPAASPCRPQPPCPACRSHPLPHSWHQTAPAVLRPPLPPALEQAGEPLDCLPVGNAAAHCSAAISGAATRHQTLHCQAAKLTTLALLAACSVPPCSGHRQRQIGCSQNKQGRVQAQRKACVQIPCTAGPTFAADAPSCSFSLAPSAALPSASVTSSAALLAPAAACRAALSTPSCSSRPADNSWALSFQPVDRPKGPGGAL